MASVYKVLTQQQFEEFKKRGSYPGTELDLRDGYIHLSSSTQVNGVLERYYQDVRPLYVLQFAEEHLGKGLVYETVRNDEKFPHLYNTDLEFTKIIDVKYIEE